MSIDQLTKRFKMKASDLTPPNTRDLLEIGSGGVPRWEKIINSIKLGLNYVPHSGKLSSLPLLSWSLGTKLTEYIASLSNIDAELPISDDVQMSLTKWLIEQHKISQNPQILEYVKLLVENKCAIISEIDVPYLKGNGIVPTSSKQIKKVNLLTLEGNISKIIANQNILPADKSAIIHTILSNVSNVKNPNFFRTKHEAFGFKTIKEYLIKTNPKLFAGCIAVCDSVLNSEEEKTASARGESLFTIFSFVEQSRNIIDAKDITPEHALLLKAVLRSCSLINDTGANLINDIASYTCLHRFIPLCIAESRLKDVEEGFAERMDVKKKLQTSCTLMLEAIKTKLTLDRRDAPTTKELVPLAAVYHVIKARISPTNYAKFDNVIREKLGALSEQFFALLNTNENAASR